MSQSFRINSIRGRIKAPPSKSMMQRALVLSLLSEGESVIVNPDSSDDSLVTLNAIQRLGAGLKNMDGNLYVTGNPPKDSDNYQTRKRHFHCGESGLVMRILPQVVALYGGRNIFVGDGGLISRPVDFLCGALEQLQVRTNLKNGKLPMDIEGRLHGGRVEVDASLSSQHISGLLIALPLTENDSLVNVRNLKSKPYIDMTLDMIRYFGAIVEAKDYQEFEIKGGQKYKSCRIEIEGDWSGAAFMLVAGALGGSVRVDGLNNSSVQGDKAVLDVLVRAGAKIETGDDYIGVKKNDLRAFEFDANDTPDLFPPLAALACACEGESVISGTSRLRRKESDRAAAIKEEFSKLGAIIQIDGDNMRIRGCGLSGAEVSSRGDHRIAMALAIASILCKEPVIIDNTKCISKSYPAFSVDLQELSD